jgi:hypothetical protein
MKQSQLQQRQQPQVGSSAGSVGSSRSRSSTTSDNNDKQQAIVNNCSSNQHCGAVDSTGDNKVNKVEFGTPKH